MSVARISLVTLLLPMARSQIFSTTGLTLTFAPDGASCETVKNETVGNGVSFFLDSSQIPAAELCVNLGDMFSQNASTQTGNVTNDAVFAEPNFANMYPKPAHASANWTSYGGDRYQPGVNYTNVWYYQQNATGMVGEGHYAALEVVLYPFEGCAYMSPNLAPYRYSCQSDLSGQCNFDSAGIKAVGFAAVNQSTSGGCYEFKKYSSGGQRANGDAVLAVGAVALTSALGFLMQ